MKYWFVILLFAASSLLFIGNAPAQQADNAAQTLEDLRMQLADLDDDVARMKVRQEQLKIESDPEHIRRFFAGVGSTDPQAMREARRRELQAESDRITARLEQLSGRRTRLESAITDAQSRAYQQSAFQAVKLGETDRSLFPTGGRALLVTTVVLLLIGTIAFVMLMRSQRNDER